jgi:zinc transporter 7
VFSFHIANIQSHIFVRLGIFVGFASFFFMEKTLRVLGGEDSPAGHSHSHSHSHSEPTVSHVSGIDPSIAQNGIRSRNSEKSEDGISEKLAHTTEGPSKLSAYLNLFGDFVHNM